MKRDTVSKKTLPCYREIEGACWNVNLTAILIARYKKALPRALFLFFQFWDMTLDDVHELLDCNDKATKTLLRILFIIEHKIKRFERFAKVVNNENAPVKKVLFARHKARQAVAFYQYLWYGISENTWRYGQDQYDKELRLKYLAEKRQRSEMPSGKGGKY